MIDVQQIFEQELASAGLMTESQAFDLLDEAIIINSSADVAKYTKACDVIIAHLIKTAGTYAAKLRTAPLTNTELRLVQDIFAKVSEARSHLVAAAATTDIMHQEEFLEQATRLLQKANFKGL